MSEVGVWILIAAAHVYGGANVTMQEFHTKSACEYAARAARAVSSDAGASAHTWCVPQYLESKGLK
jgi:hypothetical protein